MEEQKESIVINITEDDIPGAALKEPLESHTVVTLKWWLLCRDIKIRYIYIYIYTLGVQCFFGEANHLPRLISGTSTFLASLSRKCRLHIFEFVFTSTSLSCRASNHCFCHYCSEIDVMKAKDPFFECSRKLDIDQPSLFLTLAHVDNSYLFTRFFKIK